MIRDNFYSRWEEPFHNEQLMYHIWNVKSLTGQVIAQVWKYLNGNYQWAILKNDLMPGLRQGECDDLVGAKEMVRAHLDKNGYVFIDPKFLVML